MHKTRLITLIDMVLSKHEKELEAAYKRIETLEKQAKEALDLVKDAKALYKKIKR